MASPAVKTEGDTKLDRILAHMEKQDLQLQAFREELSALRTPPPSQHSDVDKPSPLLKASNACEGARTDCRAGRQRGRRSLWTGAP